MHIYEICPSAEAIFEIYAIKVLLSDKRDEKMARKARKDLWVSRVVASNHVEARCYKHGR